MIQIPRYYIENTVVDAQNERAILNHGIALSQSTSSQIIFVTYTLGHNDIFKRLFPSANEKLFKNGVQVKNLNNLIIRHVSISQYLKNSFGTHILVSTYIDSENIFAMEDKEIAIANIALPWGNNTIEKWIRTTGAINIITGVTLPPYPQPQQAVIDSLNRIMSAVNISGFSTTDMELVKREFKQLRRNDIQLNRDEIEAYLIYRTPHFVWQFVKQFIKHSGILNY